MAADGNIVIDVVLDDGSVVRGVANINGQFDDLDSNGSSRLAKVGSGLKTVASIAAVGATAVVGIGAAIGGLAAPLVKAAANAQALNAQFDQVFGDLKKNAASSLNSIAEETGILPERLKGSFTMMAAFAKTSGSDTAEALDLTKRATLAAADSAAFYDKSIEEVTESLQSYLKGNYENDSALGISSTETTRNAAANKLYGKSFNDLSEAQKQLTLLQMVEDGNKLSGALGQAARESDSLENQVGNLKQAWENLKTLLGGPILEPAIQGIKLLTKVIQGFDPAPFISTFDSIKSGVIAAIDSIKPYVQTGLENLKTFWDEHGASIVTTVRTAFDTVVTTIQNVLSEVISFVQTQLATIKQFWDEHGQSILDSVSNTFNALLDVIMPIITDAVDFIVSTWGKIKQFYDENGKQILEAVTNAFKGIMSVIEFIMPAVKFIIDTVWEAIKQVITGALDIIMGAIKIFSGLFTGDFSKMWEGIKQLFSGAIDLIVGWMTLSFVGGLKTLLTNFAKAGWNIIKGMWDDIAKVFSSMGSKVSGFASEMATKVASYFTNLFNSAKGIFTNLRSTGETIWNALKQAVVKTAKSIWDEVVSKFNGLLNSAKSIMTTVKTTITDLWSKAVDYIKNGVNLYEIGRNVIQGLINGIGSLASDVWEKVKSIGNGITNTIKSTLGIHSPSRVMRQIGLWTGEGLVIGMEQSSPKVQKAMESIGDGILAVSDKYQKEYTNLLDEFNRKNEDKNEKTLEKIYKIHNNAAKKKRKLTKQEQQEIALLEASYKDNKMQSEINFQKKYKALVEKSEKEYLEVIKNYVADKKSLEELSLLDEARIWEQSLELFAEGTTERIRAQQEYKKAVEAVNKEITAINSEYSNQIIKINEDLAKSEEALNKAYEDSVSKREATLKNTKGLFDEFVVELNRSGDELMNNLRSQIVHFEGWQREIEYLATRAIDEGLLAELREMGPNALPELVALNSMTDAQLTQYSELYRTKAKWAREVAEKEHVGMKNDTEKQIKGLRDAANKQLDSLQKEWTTKIKSLTKTTSTELSSLEQVGVDAGRGLLNGLSSMEKPLQSKAKQIADTIKSTIQSALDIHSPSRWMRDFVAGNMAKGFIVGIDKNEGIIARASEKLGELVKPTVINPLRGVRANLGKLSTRSPVNTSSSNVSNDNRRSFAPQIVNHFNQTPTTPSEAARKQEQMLRRLAMEFN